MNTQYSPVPPTTNGQQHFHPVNGARDVLRDERWLEHHHTHGRYARGMIPMRAYLLGAAALALFWVGVAILLGWRPLPW